MFGLVFGSDGQNEVLIITAPILVALVLCGIVSVCDTCTKTFDKRNTLL